MSNKKYVKFRQTEKNQFKILTVVFKLLNSLRPKTGNSGSHRGGSFSCGTQKRCALLTSPEPSGEDV